MTLFPRYEYQGRFDPIRYITYTRLISSPFSTGKSVKTLVLMQANAQAESRSGCF